MIFYPTDILIPSVSDMTAWSVVACDQFTSEPEYWENVRERAGNEPSALKLILPEAELGIKDPDAESKKINETMQTYLESGVFSEINDSFIYVERTLACGMLRRGIIGAIDLEEYDWAEGTHTKVRATEHTVEDRLPPRVSVRQKALLEMPHIMVFIDDPDDIVFSSVRAGEKLYDFDLMLGGGHVTGYRISDNTAVSDAVSRLSDASVLEKKYGTADDPMIFAMGDGNHSIAAAKKYWEQIKNTIPESVQAKHPARFALCEIVNIHDDAISFEPIHKLVYDTDPAQFSCFIRNSFIGNTGSGKTITLVTDKGCEELSVCGLTLGELIAACEEYCVAYTKQYGGSIDYIHGDDTLISLAKKTDSCGIMLPKMEKSELFTSVLKSGPFPKKSFSIGHGPDKRYYLECRKIK